MKTVGIIAEYNPFHNGHAYLINKARECGADRVVAVMSGNFVQRGEPAIFSHESRTEAALLNGVDLVLQLPSVYAMSSAQSFASAGVRILDSLGCVDELIFGSECGDISKITAAADALDSEAFKDNLTNELKKGISFASARENALRQIDPGIADIIKSPNNILAVEYVYAIKNQNSKMNPVTFGRIGADHDSDKTTENIASASLIRESINDGNWEKYVPENAVEIYKNESVADIKNIENAILYKMRTVKKEELAAMPDISEGIENRIISAAYEATTLDELYSLAKTKRYSHARIRRIVFSCFLGFTAEDLRIPAPYIRVIGFNERGAEIIRETKKTATLPIITKAADIASLGDDARKIFSSECRAGDIFALCLNSVKPCGTEKSIRPVKI